MRLICLQKAFFPAGPRKPTGGDRKRLAECACERFGIFPNASETSRTLRKLPERFGNFPNASESSRTLRNLRERFGSFSNASESSRTRRDPNAPGLSTRAETAYRASLVSFAPASAALPHSGQRSGVARRSYTHCGHRPASIRARILFRF